jgi:hypothetical protein
VPLAAVLGFMLAAGPAAAANTYWTGPTIEFVHDSFSSTVDMITSNHSGGDSVNNVWLTRGYTQPLYNAAAETGWNASVSPANTLWAVASGDLTNAASLHYDLFANVVGQPGHSPGFSVGTTFYVKIVSDNIYFSLYLESWGQNNGGSFSYIRSTPAVTATPPSVTLTNPISGAVFAAPANVHLGATASASGGTVTNVSFYTNNILLGAVTAAPFSLTASNLAAGSYALTAVATAGGLTATSTVVNVSVVSPVVVHLGSARVNAGQFVFSYTANPGLTYVVQTSTNLSKWVALVTNVPSASPVLVTNAVNPAGPTFYRVGRRPNP